MQQKNELSQKQNPNNVLFWRFLSLDKQSLINQFGISSYNPESPQDFVKDKSLYDVLISQLNLIKLTEFEYEIGNMLISSLGEDGILLKKENNYLNKKFLKNNVDKLKDIISQFEPPGCGYCEDEINKSVIVQIKQLYDNKDFLIKIVEENYNLINKRDLVKLSKIYKKDKIFIAKELELLKRVSLKPGYIGSYNAISSDIFINLTDSDIEIKTIFDDIKVNNINNESFNSTILRMFLDNYRKVIEFIVNYQKDYFISGLSNLKGLDYKTISANTFLSQSTVCRIVKDKYFCFDGNIYPLKSLVCKKLKAYKNGTVEYTCIYIKKNIIDILGLNPALSDNSISVILRNKGIKISRRTVAKYRQELNISNLYNRI